MNTTAMTSSSPAVPLFRSSLLAFLAVYYALAPFCTSPKQKSWLLTTLSSALLTAASLPFLRDYLTAGASVAAIPFSSPYAHIVNKIFQAYLVADLALGALHYRNQVNLLSGWIHHALYVAVTEYAMRNRLAGLFVLAAFMEAPTFILGLGSLIPRARTDLGFAVVFFATRIAFNLVLIVACASPAIRLGLLAGSWIPSAVLSAAFAMHLVWFKGCVDGFVKRAAAAKTKSVAIASAGDVKVVALSALQVSSEPVSVAAAPKSDAPRFATLPRRRERKMFRAEIPHGASSPRARARARTHQPAEDYLSASWHASQRTPPLLAASSDSDSDDEILTPFELDPARRGDGESFSAPIVFGVDSSDHPFAKRAHARAQDGEAIAKPWTAAAAAPLASSTSSPSSLPGSAAAASAPVPVVLRLPRALAGADVDAMGARARLRLRELRERIRARGANVYGRLRLPTGASVGGVWGYHEPEPGAVAGGVIPGGYVAMVPSASKEVLAY